MPQRSMLIISLFFWASLCTLSVATAIVCRHKAPVSIMSGYAVSVAAVALTSWMLVSARAASRIYTTSSSSSLSHYSSLSGGGVSTAPNDDDDEVDDSGHAHSAVDDDALFPGRGCLHFDLLLGVHIRTGQNLTSYVVFLTSIVAWGVFGAAAHATSLSATSEKHLVSTTEGSWHLIVGYLSLVAAVAVALRLLPSVLFFVAVLFEARRNNATTNPSRHRPVVTGGGGRRAHQIGQRSHILVGNGNHSDDDDGDEVEMVSK